MKPTTEQCLEGAKKHGIGVFEMPNDLLGNDSGTHTVVEASPDKFAAYTNDMIEQATSGLQAEKEALEKKLAERDAKVKNAIT